MNKTSKPFKGKILFWSLKQMFIGGESAYVITGLTENGEYIRTSPIQIWTVNFCETQNSLYALAEPHSYEDRKEELVL